MLAHIVRMNSHWSFRTEEIQYLKFGFYKVSDIGENIKDHHNRLKLVQHNGGEVENTMNWNLIQQQI